MLKQLRYALIVSLFERLRLDEGSSSSVSGSVSGSGSDGGSEDDTGDLGCVFRGVLLEGPCIPYNVMYCTNKNQTFFNIPLILPIGFKRLELATDLLMGVMSCRLRFVSEIGIRMPPQIKNIKNKNKNKTDVE
jgi:hypothetical protein